MAALKKQGVDTVVRRNEQGLIYGITYVDHQSKCVFNGSNLGKAYSANAIKERCLETGAGEGKKQNGEAKKMAQGGYANGVKGRDFSHDFAGNEAGSVSGFGLADVLLDAGNGQQSMDWELKRKRKKKKRLRLSPG